MERLSRVKFIGSRNVGEQWCVVKYNGGLVAACATEREADRKLQDYFDFLNRNNYSDAIASSPQETKEVEALIRYWYSPAGDARVRRINILVDLYDATIGRLF